ncbi:hypothetical protein LTR84_009406 [Exophiala bonariae]|uniref:Zn(2)-C6 fungal-type domain-containing protein n=1 Tax=Exophiala bonariae TaxID=1690606 RepID=A0AAV9MUK3_9EURO|nr:hypothetical protein LTR84_009406 [Exophiala bonariae]
MATSHDAFSPHSSTSQTTPSQLQVQVYSCLQCKHRKVKCDRIDPCGNCEKVGAECVYRAPPPPNRKKRQQQQDAALEKTSTKEIASLKSPSDARNGASEREHELLEKIRRYESLLKELGALKRSTVRSAHRKTIHHNLNYKSKPSAQIPRQTSDLVTYEAGKLFADDGRSRYFENKLWTSVTDEFQDPKEMLEESTDDEGEKSSLTGSHNVIFPSHQGRYSTPNPTDLVFPVSNSEQIVRLGSLHPQPTQIFLLWQAFLDNVNPIVKILHVPTAQKAVLDAMSNLDHVSRAMEALLFGIYTIAVTSMDDGECQSTLQESKASALGRYRAASQQALRAASILKTSDMMVLQAFVLFLLSARLFYDSYSLWALTGVCQRIGQRLGLHRDGEKLGISPFEIEMRRRLWLVIIQLDSRTAELSGSGLSLTTQPGDTKPPLNVNDCDIYPDMREPPIERERATEMMFVLLRSQIGEFLIKGDPTNDSFDGVFSKFSSPNIHMAEKDRQIDGLEQMLEEKVIRHCDQQIPVHNLASVIARASICKMRLLSHLPRNARGPSTTNSLATRLSPTEETLLFMNSVRILEYHVQIRTTPMLRRFIWHTQIQWQAVIYLLAYLRTHPYQDSRTDMAWTTIDKLFGSHPELIHGDRTRSKLITAVSILTLKAWEARESLVLLPAHGSAVLAASPPSCIAELRKQIIRSTRTPNTRVGSSKVPSTTTTSMREHDHNHNLQTHAQSNSPSDANIYQGHEADHFKINMMFPVVESHSMIAGNAFTSATADTSWMDTNPMDWENWNSIYEDFEMQGEWDDMLDSLAPFPEQ